MLATQERVREGNRTVIVWHKAADPGSCTGECDWHPIACSPIEGIVAPGPLKDVPLDLDEPGERWCADCIA